VYVYACVCMCVFLLTAVAADTCSQFAITPCTSPSLSIAKVAAQRRQQAHSMHSGESL
jgi:hypothetical protein